jgi:hypothetical protein
VSVKSMNRTAAARALTAMIVTAVCATGCGKYVRQGTSPSQLLITSMSGASGAQPDKLGNPVEADVITNVSRTVNGQQVSIPTVFNDVGSVTMSLLLKDQGQAATTGPSPLNQVTITRYRVEYRRSDGRNTPGVDVPFAFDSAVTFTVPAQGTVTAGFELVRNTAKHEAPLQALQNSPVILTTIADVTFYGRDQAGNELSTTGSMQVNFGNFGDPQ